jgi:hypothetical protein
MISLNMLDSDECEETEMLSQRKCVVLFANGVLLGWMFPAVRSGPVIVDN